MAPEARFAGGGTLAIVVDASGRPAVDSLSETVSVEIGGVRQGMFIVGRDVRNPVLLFLHRGPGMPEFFLAERDPVSYGLARSFFDGLGAPVKGFYTFERSAHSPLCEEPERMRRILREDVRVGASALADE